MTAKQQTALIVDDHVLVRTGLRRLVQDHPQIDTVVEVGSGEQALQAVSAARPDLIVMDLSLPGISGCETSLQLLHADGSIRIIVLTGSTGDHNVQRLLRSGVLGYLTKGCSSEEMDRAISEVLAGRQYLSADVARRIAFDSLHDIDESPFELLSRRELEIAMLLLDGKRNCQIGSALFISEKTVSTHRLNAFEKLGIGSTAELARLAITHGVWMGQPLS